MNSKLVKDNMSFLQFVEELNNRLSDITTGVLSEYEVELTDVEKASRSYFGLRVMTGDIGVCLDVKGVYSQYLNEGQDMDTVISDLREQLIDALENKPDVDLLGRIIDNFEIAKSHLSIKLGPISEGIVNGAFISKKIAEGLFEVPILIIECDDGMLATSVTPALCEKWEVSDDEIFSIAHRNAEEEDPLFFAKVEDVLFGDGKAQPLNNLKEGELYILSTLSKTNGAKALLYNGVMEELSKNGNFYIIPASVNEVLIIKADEGISAEGLLETLTLVNAGLHKDEFLSSKLYLYDSKRSLITYAESRMHLN